MSEIEVDLDFEAAPAGRRPNGGGKHAFRTTTGWTDERVEQLKSLWTEGLSGSQIARVLGGVTRNAVIGKVVRLGLASRNGQARVTHQKAKGLGGIPRLRQVAPPADPVVELPPLVLDDGAHVTLMTLTSRTCRWPIGDPATPEFHFCGHKPKLGSSYCEAHALRAYQPAQVRAATDRYLTRKPKWA